MGDVALYSLHKMFPIPDGGMAIYRRGADVQNLLTTRPDLAQEVLSYDWSAISLARRENFTVATQLLREARDRGAPLELVWPDLHADDVPQSLPIYVLPPTRDRIYELMNAAGYGVVSLYHTLIPELRSGFPVSAWAAEHILNVPVHQDVQPGRLVELIQTLERLLTELASD
jgi:dTDP-4-amino-4,6-dideoxygalactose transaminase